MAVVRRYRVNLWSRAGAGNRQPEEGTCRGINLFVDDVQFEQGLVALIERLRASARKPVAINSSSVVYVCRGQAGPHDLFADELLEGFVAIKEDYVISVTPACG